VLNEHPFLLLPKYIDRFIMVNCSPRESLTKSQLSAVDLLRASLNIMQNEITQLRLAAVPSYKYLQIEPNVHGRNLLEREKAFKTLIEIGVKTAAEQTEEIRRFLKI
jgi:hypothetical protein